MNPEQSPTTDTQKRSASLAASAAWLTCGRVASFVMGFALPLLLVRRLDQTALGLYKQAYLFVNHATTVLPFGVAMSAFYFLPREDKDGQRRTIFNIILFHIAVGLITLLILTLEPSILARIFGSPELTHLAPQIGLLIFFWLLGQLIDTIAIANNEAKLATAFIIIAQLSKTALLLAAGIFFGTVEALIYAGIAHSFAQMIIVFVYLHRRFPHFWRAFDSISMRALLAYSLPFGATALLWTMQLELHNYFVSHYFGAAMFAIYSIGCFELPLIGTLGDSVGAVLIPRISRLQKEGNAREIVLQTARVLRKLSALYLPTYVFLLVMSRELIVFLFTAQYVASVKIYAINLTLLPFYALMLDPIVRSFAAEGRFVLKLRIVMLPVLIFALWQATARGNLLAVISVVVAFHLLEKAILSVRLAHLLGVTRRDVALISDVGRIIIAAALAGAATEMLRLILKGASPFVMLVLCGALFVSVYGALVRSLKIVAPEEREALQNFIASIVGRFTGRGAKRETNAIESLT
jgi:O-antigen/teichoic acid export membrane protein